MNISAIMPHIIARIPGNHRIIKLANKVKFICNKYLIIVDNDFVNIFIPEEENPIVINILHKGKVNISGLDSFFLSKHNMLKVKKAKYIYHNSNFSNECRKIILDYILKKFTKISDNIVMGITAILRSFKKNILIPLKRQIDANNINLKRLSNVTTKILITNNSVIICASGIIFKIIFYLDSIISKGSLTIYYIDNIITCEDLGNMQAILKECTYYKKHRHNIYVSCPKNLSIERCSLEFLRSAGILNDYYIASDEICTSPLFISFPIQEKTLIPKETLIPAIDALCIISYPQHIYTTEICYKYDIMHNDSTQTDYTNNANTDLLDLLGYKY